MDDVKWAVGGISLFPSDTALTESEYYSRIASEMGDAPPDPYSFRPRTAVVYFGGPLNGLNTALLTVYGAYGDDTGHPGVYLTSGSSGVTLWELRSLINDHFGAMGTTPRDYIYHAICLDGGGSSCIRAKKDGVDVTYAPVLTAEGNARYMRSILSVEM